MLELWNRKLYIQTLKCFFPQHCKCCVHQAHFSPIWTYVMKKRYSDTKPLTKLHTALHSHPQTTTSFLWLTTTLHYKLFKPHKQNGCCTPRKPSSPRWGGKGVGELWDGRPPQVSSSAVPSNSLGYPWPFNAYICKELLRMISMPSSSKKGQRRWRTFPVPLKIIKKASTHNGREKVHGRLSLCLGQ